VFLFGTVGNGWQIGTGGVPWDDWENWDRPRSISRVWMNLEDGKVAGPGRGVIEGGSYVTVAAGKIGCILYGA